MAAPRACRTFSLRSWCYVGAVHVVGQTVAGVIIDAIGSGSIDALKIAGTAILLCGLALDTLWSHGLPRGSCRRHEPSGLR